jgi:hypothetical protein
MQSVSQSYLHLIALDLHAVPPNRSSLASVRCAAFAKCGACEQRRDPLRPNLFRNDRPRSLAKCRFEQAAAGLGCRRAARDKETPAGCWGRPEPGVKAAAWLCSIIRVRSMRTESEKYEPGIWSRRFVATNRIVVSTAELSLASKIREGGRHHRRCGGRIEGAREGSLRVLPLVRRRPNGVEFRTPADRRAFEWPAAMPRLAARIGRHIATADNAVLTEASLAGKV